jgi:hypothetical protein
MKLDNCPLPLQSNSLNVKNHLYTIENHGLGPADPRQPNEDFWRTKSLRWGCSEGDARGRLCANCEHYVNTTQIEDCIANGPAYNLKASQLPLTPKWADIESHPVAYCTKFDITCSPVRTCDEQEMGGPIDDERVEAMPEEEAINYTDLTKSSIDDTTEE